MSDSWLVILVSSMDAFLPLAQVKVANLKLDLQFPNQSLYLNNYKLETKIDVLTKYIDVNTSPELASIHEEPHHLRATATCRGWISSW